MRRAVFFWSFLGLALFAWAPRVSPAQVGRGGGSALEAAIAHAQTAVGPAYGPCTFRDGDGYLGMEGEVAVYALEFYSPEQRSPVTVIVDGRAAGLPVIETRLGLPPHRDPDVLARAVAAVAARTGKPAGAPDSFLCPAWPTVWAAFAQPGAAAGTRLYCNLADGRIETLEALGAKTAKEAGLGVLAGSGAQASEWIAVNYPTGSDIIFYLGCTYTIQWQAFSGTSVNIELYNGTTRVLTIASATPNDNSHSWTVPVTLTRSSKYKIKISNTADPDENAWSIFYFSISGAKVLTPAGPGTVWLRGEYYDISWSGFSGMNVRIELYNGSVLSRTISSAAVNYVDYFADTPRVSYYIWTVPQDLPTGKTYKIKIVSNDYPSFIAWSDQFAVAERVIPEVLYPRDADIKLGAGGACTIRWSGFSGNSVKIELYKAPPGWWGADTLALTIAATAMNDGDLLWRLPGTLERGSYKIKVSATADPAQFDMSYNYFQVLVPKVVAPSASGIVLPTGQAYYIRWSGYEGANVKIDLYNGSVLSRTIAPAAPTYRDLYYWQIPSDLPSGANYKIRIQCTTYSGVYDWSDSIFAISQAKVVYPSVAGTVLQPGQACSIQWSKYLGSTVKIELYNGAALSRTIAAAATNNGAYSWKVPSDLPNGTGYKIKITSNTYSWMFDWSDAAFGIMMPQVTWPTATGVTWMRGMSYTVTWSGIAGTAVRIELYKGTALARVLAATTANDGSFAWTVLNSQSIGSDYKIKITSTSSAASGDWSDNAFTIDNSFFPVLMTDAAGSPVNAYWKYRVNNGKAVDIDKYITGDNGAASVRPNDLTIGVDRTRLERSGSFTGKFSGDASGNYSKSFVEKLQSGPAGILITEQSLDMDASVSADSVDADFSLDFDVDNGHPPIEWFLDRADLDKLSVGYVFDQPNVTEDADLRFTGEVGDDSGDLSQWHKKITSAERWQILEKLSKMTVQGKEYRNVVKVKRKTVLPFLFDKLNDGSLTYGVVKDVDMIYWVAKGVGMIKGEGQYLIVDKPVTIELLDSNMKP